MDSSKNIINSYDQGGSLLMQRDEAEKTLQLTRKKKEEVINDIKKRQAQFYNYAYNNKGQQSLTSSQRAQFLEEQNVKPKARGQNFSMVITESQSSPNNTRTSNTTLLTQIGSNAPQIQSNEWYKYLLKNLKTMEGLEWVDELIKFLKEYQDEFKVTKFRGQIFYLTYSKRQLESIPLRSRLLSYQRNSRALDDIMKTSTSPKNESILKTHQISMKEEISENESTRKNKLILSNTKSEVSQQQQSPSRQAEDDCITDIYFQEKIEKQLQYDTNIHRFMYGLEGSTLDKNMNTLEQMDDPTSQLFFIIKQQLQESEHPLNVITRVFNEKFIQHYTDQIMQSSKKTYYFITEKNKDYSIAYLDEEEKIQIEQDFFDQELQQRHKSINRSISQYSEKQLKKPSFPKSKKEIIKEKQQMIRYKMAEGAIGEVKQFLCVMYGCCVRFYNSVIRQDKVEQMKEDIIEALTSLVFQNQMAKLLFTFSRICTSELEEKFHYKLHDLSDITPKLVGVGQYFTLDKSSKIQEIFCNQQVQENEGGDVGGSALGLHNNEESKDEEDNDNCYDRHYSEQDPSINHSFANDELVTTQQQNFAKALKPQTYKSQNQLSEKQSFAFQSMNQQNYQIQEEEKHQITQNFDDDDQSLKIEILKNEDKDNSYSLNSLSTSYRKKNPLTISAIQQRLKVRPYDKAIQELQKIQNLDTPFEKLQCISKVSKQIVKCISKFWSGINVKKDKLTIDGDTLLMIYIYVCLKSKINYLFAHVKLMNEFSTPFVRSTKLGYCLSTMEVALNHIVNLTRDDLNNDDSQGFNERQKSLTRNYRQLVQMSARTSSLLILDDPYEEYFKKRAQNGRFSEVM